MLRNTAVPNHSITRYLRHQDSNINNHTSKIITINKFRYALKTAIEFIRGM